MTQKRKPGKKKPEESELAATALPSDFRLALLSLAEELNNVSKACSHYGVSRDTFYRIKRVFDSGGSDAVRSMGHPASKRDKRLPNDIESSILATARERPEWGPVKVSAHLLSTGRSVSPSGVRAVWQRHAMTTVRARVIGKQAQRASASTGMQPSTAIIDDRPAAKQLASDGVAELRFSDRLGDSDTALSLLMSSLDLFARQNYSSVTIKDIANATGINTSLIYYYFGSKEGLFMKVVELATKRAFESFNNIKNSASRPDQIISLWIENHVLQFELMQKLIKISIDYANTQNHAPELEKAIRRFYDIEAEVLENAIRMGIEQSLFAVVDPVRITAFISTFLDGALIRSVMMPERNAISSILDMRSFVLEQLLIQGKSPKATSGRAGPD